MASLVTLGASPYSAYNTSFAGIAMQGLAMAQREMDQRDQLAQASYSNYMRNIQFGADLLFKGQEMQLAKRKQDFAQDQAMFERKMAIEDREFRKEQFGEQKRQFNVGAGMDERRIDLAEDKFKFDKTVYEDAEPLRNIQQTNAALQAAGNAQNLTWAIQDRPFAQRTQQTNEQLKLIQTGLAIQNAETSALNAETNAEQLNLRRQSMEQYDRHRAQAVRAYDSLIRQKDQQIASARKLVTEAGSAPGGSKRVEEAKRLAQANVKKLEDELSALKEQKTQFETQNGGPSATDIEAEQRQREDDRLYRLRHGVDASLFPANTTGSTYE